MVVIVAASAVVLFEQMHDKLRRDHSPIEKSPAGEVIPHETAQRSAQPAPQRHAEAPLGLAQQFRWQPMPHGANEDVLAAAILELPECGMRAASSASS